MPPRGGPARHGQGGMERCYSASRWNAGLASARRTSDSRLSTTAARLASEAARTGACVDQRVSAL
jgi:hypothetical protein